MATPQERNDILSSLRPVFPQLGDNELEECIENVRRTVGESRELIIPGCIDLLLARTANQERNPGRDYPGMAVAIQDEIPRHEMTYVNDISDEEFSEEVEDDELMYVATSIQGRPDLEIYFVDDSPPLSKNSTCKTTSSLLSPKRKKNGSNKRSSSELSPSSVESTSGLTLSPPSTTCAKSPITNPIRFCVEKIKRLFPDVQEKYLRELLESWGESPVDNLVNRACNYLIENGSYPKEEEKIKCSVKSPPEKTHTCNTDYLKEFSSPTSYVYERQCLSLLENEFPMVSVRDIRNIARKFNCHYAPTRKYLEEKMIEAHQSKLPTSSFRNGNSTSGSIRLLKTKRRQHVFESFHLLVPELQKEINFIKKYKINEAEEKDRQMAFILNEKQYEEEGQKIECGCCYGEATFEDMIQCLDGHLFCIDCLQNYAKEAVFGQGKAMLSCMTSECDSTFSMSQLKKTLASNIFSKYEDRLTEESLCLAEMDDLVRCPSCDFAAILPSEDKVFKCQNTSCLKETCRFCKEDWKEHFGLKCNEVEKKEAKNVRLSYEEKMTMAKIRKCHKCGCEFTKSDGCNKMTCRCGTTMCYICRKPGISYAHFCQHPREPGKKCDSCKNCSLWSDPSEDDNMAVRQLEREAEEVKRKATDSSEGETLSKRPRTSNPSVNLHVGNLVQPIK
ncbi:E3 ubiquitin-protein ligase RNF216-like [Actinia tenebrosa]|uniref:E3 ubiquitin-protein ligase RNF216-like n=1 Tax=Actinia tenebrosa TaxID=6105 RepID=A0A6P8JG94_ACTTE|nr:E3 ubiquitin-protein ligase RNF216-like [Actinia tenebrosa]